MKKTLQILGGILAILIVIFLAGPKPNPNVDIAFPNYIPNNPAEVEKWVQLQESYFDIKPDNQARIVWADSTKKQKTNISVVYIHGFSASQGEGYPVHREFARRYNANLYLARLSAHGLKDPDAFKNLRAEDMIISALEALAIANVLGDSVIVLGTSTGGTLALHSLAQFPKKAHALFLFSPLIDFYDKTTRVLGLPWGSWLSRKVIGSDYVGGKEPDPNIAKYWYSRYHIDGLLALKALVDHTMKTSVFEKIQLPTFVGYYYKDQENQDNTVSIKAIQAMAEQLGVPSDKKQVIAFENAGAHVITSEFTSKDLESLRKAVFQFAEKKLGLKP